MNKKYQALIAAGATVALLAGGIGVATLSQAEPTPAPPRTVDTRGPGQGLNRVELDQTLAEKLGIDQAKVADIFTKNRRDREAIIKALVEASGKDEATVVGIMDEVRPPRYLERVPALAKTLGLDEAVVKKAFVDNRNNHDGVLKALVAASGKDEATVLKALQDNRPGMGKADGQRGPGQGANDGSGRSGGKGPRR